MEKSENNSEKKRKLIAAFGVIAVLAVAVAIIIAVLFNSEDSSVDTEHRIRVACVGDSITYGLRIEDRESNSYPAVLGRLLDDGFEVKNFGVSGSTAMYESDSPYADEERYKQSLKYMPNIVVIMFGTNDSKQTNWKGSETFIKDYNRLIDSYLELDTKPEIYVVSPPPVFFSDDSEAYKTIAELIDNEISSSVQHISAAKGIGYIDMNTSMRNKENLFIDGIHPDAEGADLFAHVVYSEITG